MLRDLNNHTARRTGRAGDNQLVALLRLTDNHQTIICSQARAAQCAEVVRQAQAVGERLDGRNGTGVQDGVFVPVYRTLDDGAFGQLFGFAVDHLAEASSAHDLADLDGFDVQSAGGDVGTDPASLGRVVAVVERLDQDLVVVQWRQIARLQCKGRLVT